MQDTLFCLLDLSVCSFHLQQLHTATVNAISGNICLQVKIIHNFFFNALAQMVSTLIGAYTIIFPVTLIECLIKP